jgi:3-oxoacyl-[acyl-carrier protein] reductase
VAAPVVAVTVRFADLAGRVAVVTGASRGIGAATAKLFAANGMAVALLARDEAALEDVREQIWNLGGHAISCPTDCTRPEQLAVTATRVEEELGTPAVLAAFAGGGGRPAPSLSMAVDEWRRILDGDLTATFATIQAFAPAMTGTVGGVGGADHRGKGGAIVTMSSAAGRAPSQANVAYAVAKAGVVMLTRHLAAELAPHGVRVNAIAPSAIRNEKMSAAMSSEQLGRLGASFPLGRVGEPDDVAAAAAYLASDASGWVTGITLDVSGGKVL